MPGSLLTPPYFLTRSHTLSFFGPRYKQACPCVKAGMPIAQWKCIHLYYPLHALDHQSPNVFLFWHWVFLVLMVASWLWIRRGKGSKKLRLWVVRDHQQITSTFYKMKTRNSCQEQCRLWLWSTFGCYGNIVLCPGLPLPPPSLHILNFMPDLTGLCK